MNFYFKNSFKTFIWKLKSPEGFLVVMVILVNFGIDALIPFNVPKKITCFCISFSGLHSLQIRTEIHNLCSSVFTHINVRLVFRPIKRLSHFFPVQDRLPKGLRSRVVYSFKCQCCNALYVGQAACHLHARVSDHLGVSPLTGKERANPSPSNILSLTFLKPVT